MALVKTTLLPAKGQPLVARAPEPPARTAAVARRSLDRSRARRDKAAERIAAATEQLAAGITQASAAAEQLRRALEQISAATEEAAGAAQESQAALGNLATVFTQGRDRADGSSRRSDEAQALLLEMAAQIDAAIAWVQETAARQLRAVEVVARLEAQAATIGEVTGTVSDISDQTNLLALNAAIEAARAGEHGRGFAVVADEVRAFAETSERGARDVQELAAGIGDAVRQVAQRIRAAAGQAQQQAQEGAGVIATLEAVRAGMGTLAANGREILLATQQADAAAREALRGGEQVASAAEEQSAAVAEAQRAVAQQAAALDQSQQTAQALAALADELQGSATLAETAEQVASAAEELSTTVQELSGAAAEITAAIGQVSLGAQSQAAATQQSSSAMAQIEQAAGASRATMAQAVERLEDIGPRLQQAGLAVRALGHGVEAGVAELAEVGDMVATLEVAGRQIEKIVDGIALVAVQTNMLAVSGAVEAARSGEHGRGFAVVSGDIRALARDSGENAGRMRDLVRDVQDHVARVRRELELIVAGAQVEIGRNRSIAGRLAGVEGDLAGLRGGYDEILAGADILLATTREVLGGTRQIAQAAEATSVASAQAATAARQQARGAEDLAAAIEEIASLADELRITDG